MNWEDLVSSTDVKQSFVEHFEPLCHGPLGKRALADMAERVERFEIIDARSDQAVRARLAEYFPYHQESAPAERFLRVHFVTEANGEKKASSWLCWPPAATLPERPADWARALAVHGEIRCATEMTRAKTMLNAYDPDEEYIVEDRSLSYEEICEGYTSVVTFGSDEYYLAKVDDACVIAALGHDADGLYLRGDYHDEDDEEEVDDEPIGVGDAFLCFVGLFIAIGYDYSLDKDGTYGWFAS
ncbi:MAG: hypothetical protein KC503_00925 [Myxococcales bacterium]|nr:hypothetical protein [Myxococcales bacterium]